MDAFLLETKKAVAKGDKVAVAGFGVFESTARKARMGRNPRTGEAVKIKATKLPKFRPGAEFKGVVFRRQEACGTGREEDNREEGE